MWVADDSHAMQYKISNNFQLIASRLISVIIWMAKKISLKLHPHLNV